MVASAAVRRQWVKVQLQETNRWPTAQDIMTQFQCSKSPAYRDLEAVTKELSVEFDIERLRLQVMKRLGDRMPELADRDLVRLGVAFLPQKIEQKSQVELKGRMSDGDRELLERYAGIIEKVVKRSVPENDPEKSLDPAQTH